MPGVDHPVHFARTAPFDVTTGQLVFYDVVLCDVMSRSSVLTCIAEADGEAKLPDSVTLSEFKSWISAVSGNDAVFQTRSFDFMCTAIKVADALDDSHIDAWVRLAAKEMSDNALSTCSQTRKAKTIAEGLSGLTLQLQHRLFSAAAFDSEHLRQLVAFFPACLRSAMLSAMISSEKEFHMPLTPQSGPELEALASVPASPPSLLSLHIASDSHNMCNDDVGSEVWPNLTKVLHRHSSLTSLLLSGSIPQSIVHKHLFPAVAILTSLQSLDLDGCVIGPEDSSTALQSTLQALPRLCSLKLTLTESSVQSTMKRQRDAGAAAPPRHCLVAMLCPCTALTSLHLEVSTVGRCVRHFTAAGPLRMPHLVQLTALFGDNVHLGAAFFSHLSAPLTSLNLSESQHFSQPIPCAAAADAGRLLRSLAAFTQLRCLSAVLPIDLRHQTSVRNTLISALPTVLTALELLQDVSIAAAPAVLQRVVPPLATTALTRLNLGPSSDPSDTRYVTIASDAAWHDFFRCLRDHKLRALELDFRGATLRSHGLAALSTLTQLTVLSIHGWSCFGSPADAHALVAMTQLQRLCLNHTKENFRVEQACVDAMHGLSALTGLLLKTSERDKHLIGRLLARPLRALQELTLALYDPFETAVPLEFCMMMGELPELRQLTVHLHPASDPVDDYIYDSEDSEDVRETSTEQRVADIQHRLEHAAALARVELKIKDETDFCY